MNNKVKKKYVKRIRTILIVLICIWLFLIFIFSQQDGDTSSGVSFKIAKLLFRTEEAAKSMEIYVRKVAHMIEYAAGGVLFSALFMTYDMQVKKRNVITTCIVTAIAGLDELHQSFIPGRTGVWYDVLIDFAGCIIGVFVFQLIIKLIKFVDYMATSADTNTLDDVDNPYKNKID